MLPFKDMNATDRTVYEYLRALDCPRALTVWLLYSNGEHRQVAELEWDPICYNGMSETRDSLSATKFLSKATFLDTSIDVRKVALEKFFDAEQVCKETNRRIRSSAFKNGKTCAAMYIASQKIANILGDFDADEFVDSCNWGPGATTSLKKSEATSPKKYVVSHDITQAAYDFVEPWFDAAYPLWEIGSFCIQDSSKIVTVPKNSKTDRTIAIEPDLNVWFQKGIGSMIRRRLRRVGIDLRKQSINAERARLGSLYGELTTVDFSAASDTISLELVRELIPRDWFTLLMAFRSSYGTVDGRTVRFEKISSMGNGFTFELETLIFYALALAVCELQGVDSRGLSVYGDDVVLPTSTFELYSSISQDWGFTVNKSKSYSTTYFRESCGSYWYKGVDIKPIFLRERVDSTINTIKIANNVRWQAHRRSSYYGCDLALSRCWHFLAGLLGDKTPRISFGYGDVGLIENINGPHVSVERNRNGHEGYLVKVWLDQPVMSEISHHGLFLFRLRQIGNSTLLSDDAFAGIISKQLECRSDGNDVAIPLRTRRSRKRIAVPRWYDMGDWF